MSDHVEVTVDPLDPTRLHFEFSAVVPSAYTVEIAAALSRIEGAQILREQARAWFLRWMQGTMEWSEVIEAVRWADEARNELTAVERQEHDRWLFREPMWGMM